MLSANRRNQTVDSNFSVKFIPFFLTETKIRLHIFLVQKIVKQGEEVVVDLVVEDMEYVVHVRYIIFSIISIYNFFMIFFNKSE